MTERESELLRVAASLHDVGKACIPDHILTKPGPLTAQEWETMKSHAKLGHELLSRSSLRVHEMAAQIAHEHHEWWNGTGYPVGLSGEAISLAGRITSVADVLDSLVSARCYKQAWSLPDALQYLKDQSGKQFDPELINLVRTHQVAIEKIYAF